MDYLATAPITLIHEYERHLSGELDEHGTRDLAEELIADIPQAERTPKRIALARKWTRKLQIDLPIHESKQLLGRLISDQRMSETWRKLDKRMLDGDDPTFVFVACSEGISKWRLIPPKTNAQRQAHFKKIARLAHELRDALFDVTEFDRLTSIDMLSSAQLVGLVNMLDPDSKIGSRIRENHLRSVFRDRLYPVEYLIEHLGIQAEELSLRRDVVGKPTSENSHIHFFMRYLSAFFSERFGLPLYEAVAAFTAVSLELPDIDPTLVRKIVKRQPGTKSAEK